MPIISLKICEDRLTKAKHESTIYTDKCYEL